MDDQDPIGDVALRLALNDTGSVLVAEVVEGGAAFFMGIMAGDEVLAINGASTAQTPLGVLRHALQGPVGEPVALSLRRSGQRLEIPVRRSRAMAIP